MEKKEGNWGNELEERRELEDVRYVGDGSVGGKGTELLLL